MWFEKLLHESWMVLTELAPWLFLGAFIAGVLHRYVSDAWLERALRGRGGVARAVLFGVPMPLCSCGVIPAGVSLKQRGASDKSAIAFMISTPQTGVDSILVSASFLGWPFALFKLLSAALLGLVGGFLTPANEAKPAEPLPEAPERTWRASFEHGVEIIQSIWGWLAFGVLASAALSTLVPAESLANIAEASGAWAILAVLAVSVPLYVCATASVPIAAALVAGGFPVGAALVFLMAGPATNIATLGAVYRTFGGRTLAVYLGTIVLGSVGLGLAFDSLLVDASTHAAPVHAAAWWEQLAAGVLLAMFAGFAIESLKPRAAMNTETEAPLVVVGVDGLTCNGCVRKLEKELERVSEGQDDASFEVELDGGYARARGLSPETLRGAVEHAGFRVRVEEATQP